MASDADLRALLDKLSSDLEEDSSVSAYLKLADRLESLLATPEPEQAARERPEPEIRSEASQFYKCDTYAPLANAYLEGYRAAERSRT